MPLLKNQAKCCIAAMGGGVVNNLAPMEGIGVAGGLVGAIISQKGPFPADDHGKDPSLDGGGRYRR